MIIAAEIVVIILMILGGAFWYMYHRTFGSMQKIDFNEDQVKNILPSQAAESQYREAVPQMEYTSRAAQRMPMHRLPVLLPEPSSDLPSKIIPGSRKTHSIFSPS